MDIIKQSFTNGFNRLNVLSKGFESAVPPRKHGFFELQNLFTDSSFGLNIRKYVFDNSERVSRVYSQMDLISIGRINSTLVSKGCTTMKSLHYPNGNNWADRAAGNSNLIRRKISILLHKFRYPNGTFCINITSKIGKVIFVAQLSFSNRPDIGYVVNSCDDRIFSALSKLFENSFPFNGKLAGKELNKNFALRKFLFQEGKNTSCNFKSLFSSNGPFILDSPINILGDTLTKVSTKSLLNGNKNIFFGRNNRNGTFPSGTPAFTNSSSCGKMAIAIDVSSQVGEIYSHTHMLDHPSILSQQVIAMKPQRGPNYHVQTLRQQ